MFDKETLRMEHDSFTWCVWFTKTIITKEISRLLALRIWWGLFGRPFVLLLYKMLQKRGFLVMSQWNSGGYRAKEYLRERELFSQKLSIHHATCTKLHWNLGPNIDSKGVKQSSWKGEHCHWYFLKCVVFPGTSKLLSVWKAWRWAMWYQQSQHWHLPPRKNSLHGE